MHDLTGFQRDCLSVIADHGSPTVPTIAEVIETQYDDVNRGRFYPNLNQLVERVFVQKETTVDRTNEYLLTERGRGAVVRQGEWARHRLNAVAPTEIS